MQLKELTALRAPSGFEDEARSAIAREAEAILAGEGRVFADTIGNLYAVREARRAGLAHVMLCAHMDEAGFIVTRATDEGLLKLACVGEIDAQCALSRRVLVGEKGVPGVVGLKAIHLMSREEREARPKLGSLAIDIGASSKEEAERLCPPGSYAAFDSAYREFGEGFVKAKALGSRAGCAVLLHALRESRYAGKITCVFTAQHEVGLRGAAVAGKRVQPDVALVLDGAQAMDMGMTPAHERGAVCGGGAAVYMMDRRRVTGHALMKRALDVAAARGIGAQVCRGLGIGSDAGALELCGAGIPCLTLGVPCRYIRTPSCVARRSDIEAAKALTLAMLEDMEEHAHEYGTL